MNKRLYTVSVMFVNQTEASCLSLQDKNFKSLTYSFTEQWLW